jgi:hypothetical protein
MPKGKKGRAGGYREGKRGNWGAAPGDWPIDMDHSPRRRRLGPRALGTNPRALGTNPRAMKLLGKPGSV